MIALAEYVIVRVYPAPEGAAYTVQTFTHGIITLLLGLFTLSFKFFRYVDQWSVVKQSITDLTNVLGLGVEDLRRLAPIAKDEEMVRDFLQRFGVNNQAKVSELERTVASLQAANKDLQSNLQRIVSKYEKENSEIVASARQMQSEFALQKSELERKLSELTLQLNSWKEKYQVLELGTDEQKAQYLKKLYISAQYKLNGKRRKIDGKQE